MHKLTAPSFQSRLATQESSEPVGEFVGILNPVTTTHSLESRWRRAIQMTKALARPHLRLQILLLVYTFTIPTIGLLVDQRRVNYVHNGTILFIIEGVATGLTLAQTERPLLLADVTPRKIRRVAIIFAWATIALIAISMGYYAVLDVTPGGVKVADVYMIKHTGIGPYLWFLAPVGTFSGVIASVCMSIANRYLSSRGIAAVVVPTVLLMNPISYLIIPHAFHSGPLGYVSYLLVASIIYPLLLRFILNRPRNKEWATQGGTRGTPVHHGNTPIIWRLSCSFGDSAQYREPQGGANLGP